MSPVVLKAVFASISETAQANACKLKILMLSAIKKFYCSFFTPECLESGTCSASLEEIFNLLLKSLERLSSVSIFVEAEETSDKDGWTFEDEAKEGRRSSLMIVRIRPS